MKKYFFILIFFFSSHLYINAQESIDTTLTFKSHIGNYPDYKGIDDLMQKVEIGVNELLKKNTGYRLYSKKDNNYFLKISCEDKNLELKFSFIKSSNTSDGMRYFAGIGVIDSVEVNDVIDREKRMALFRKTFHFYDTKEVYTSTNIRGNYFYYSNNGYENDKSSLLIDKVFVKGESKEIYFKYSFDIGLKLFTFPIQKSDEYDYNRKIELSKKLKKPELSIFFLNNLKLQHGEARYIGSGKDGKARIYAKTVEEARLTNAKNSPLNESKSINTISNSNDLGKSNSIDIESSKIIKDNKNSIWSDDPAIFLKQLSVAEAAIKNSKLSISKKQEALAKIIPLKKQAQDIINLKKLGQEWSDFSNQKGKFDKNGKIVKSHLSKYFTESENKLLLKILNNEFDLDPQLKNRDRCGNILENCKFCGRQFNANKYYRSIGYIMRDLDGLPVMVRLTDSEIKELKYYLARIRSGSYYVCLTNENELFCTKEHNYLFNKM